MSAELLTREAEELKAQRDELHQRLHNLIVALGESSQPLGVGVVEPYLAALTALRLMESAS